MKKIISYTIAALIIGAAVAALMYFVFKSSAANSIIYGMSAAAGGLGGEIVKWYMQKRKTA